MKKVSTAAQPQSGNFLQANLTIGLDLGDRSSWYCVLDEAGYIATSSWSRKCLPRPRLCKRHSEPCRAAVSLWRRGCIRHGSAGC